MTKDEQKAITNIAMQVFNLSCELDQLSSRAHWLEDNLDEIRYHLVDLCGTADTDIVEEEEEE